MEALDAHYKEFVQFLDGARNVPSVQEQKRIILEMLALQAGEKLLDIGCGTGDDVRAESECEEWLEQLKQAGRAEHFFMSTNHYIVCGRKAYQ